MARKAIALLCLFSLGLLWSGCSAKGNRQGDGERRESVEQNKPAAAAVPEGAIRLSAQQAQANGIQTATARQETLTPAIAVVGRVQAQPGRESDVASPFAGRLVYTRATPPPVGSHVKQGQVLAEVEQLLSAPERTQFASQLTQAESEAAQAQQEVDLRRRELDRARQLYDGGAIPLKQYQTAEFNLQQSESRWKAARATVEQVRMLLSQGGGSPRRTPIIAPISGTVVTADLLPGMHAEPAKSLMKIVDLSTVWVRAAVPEADLGAVRKAGRAELTAVAVPGRIYTAALVTVGPAVDSASRTVPIIFSVANRDAALRLDMTVEVRIPSGPQASAVLIPSSAVLYGAGQALVFVEEEPGLYRRRSIAAGESRGSELVVRSGLNAGEKVVSAGAEALRSELLKGQIQVEER